MRRSADDERRSAGLDRDWCRIGRHEFSMTRVGRPSAGVELVRA